MYSHLTPAVAAYRTADDVRRAAEQAPRRRRRAVPLPQQPTPVVQPARRPVRV